jgi:hypothetical protein
MSETDTQKYRCGTDEQKKALGVSEDYHLLVGPNGFWTFLGEPEDRVWYRDGADAVNELNRLERELSAMTAERDQWKAKYIQANKDYGCELRDPNGTIWSYTEELRKERDALIAENQWHLASEPPIDRLKTSEENKPFMYIRSNGYIGIEENYWGFVPSDVTHWRELPQPPKGEAT